MDTWIAGILGLLATLITAFVAYQNTKINTRQNSEASFRDSLLEQVKRLQERSDQLDREINETAIANAKMQIQLTRQEEEMNEQKKVINELRIQVTTLLNERDFHVNRANALTEENAGLRQKLTIADAKVTYLERERAATLQGKE